MALSGGGSRAMAFHLGCLRALRSEGLLNQVSTISAVSGGSVLAALYCSHPGDFDEFERVARRIIGRGFVRPAVRAVFTTSEGLKALGSGMLTWLDRVAALSAGLILKAVPRRFRPTPRWLKESQLRRSASRTTVLQRVFDNILDGRTLVQLRDDRPKLIIVACDLMASSAFYFAKDGVGSWRRGVAAAGAVRVAEAVAASAAYPVFLPTLELSMTFTKKGGQKKQERVVLTDGGVYDNLGLAPLWPDRDPSVSLHVGSYDRLIVSRAGYSTSMSAAPALWGSRMYAVMNTMFSRSQNATMKRLFDLQKGGSLKSFILPYLGQADDQLANPPSDLVRAEDVANYPTDFSAMPSDWIEKLSQRGEQLTRSLIVEHWQPANRN
ncbi:patatin-like phospholipase family protein [Paracoccus endophyticus]|uniref:patatin-like phospholipase family protein n=1 Tax=Paracoccus endophyticus TaxID=2233774 RepID=UPI0013A68D11|nr:patatin-like phospholipase family protein [Paracoccus endophyticus]